MQSPERSIGSGEVALWRAVIDQALQDALATERIMKDGRPTFASLEGDKARYWFWRHIMSKGSSARASLIAPPRRKLSAVSIAIPISGPRASRKVPITLTAF